MANLLEKHRPITERHARMLAAGANAVGLTIDKILSPTRAMINGRETILAGTNNYMGITFDPDCIAAGQKALAAELQRYREVVSVAQQLRLFPTAMVHLYGR